MWSHFTDLALKAQKDLQDQAHEAAQALQHTAPPVASIGSFFNLDSMQQQSHNNKTESAFTNSDTVISTTTLKNSSSDTNTTEDTILNTNMPHLPSSIIHEDTSSNSSISRSGTYRAANATENNSTTSFEPPQNEEPSAITNSAAKVDYDVETVVHKEESVSLLHSAFASGPLEPRDVESDTRIVPSTVIADDDDDDDDSSSAAACPLEHNDSPNGMKTLPETAVAPVSTNENEQNSLIDSHTPTAGEIATTLQQPKQELDNIVQKTEAVMIPDNSFLPSLPTKSSFEESNTNVTRMDESRERKIESQILVPDTEDNVTKEEKTGPIRDVVVGESSHDVEGTNGSNEHFSVTGSTHLPMSPSPSKPRWTKKLLILISTNSIDRQVKVRQDLVQTALTAAGIDFECLDGSVSGDNDESIVLRNELFALSGQRGVYPQLFLVDLINGGTTFWGTFTEFQHVNDDGQLAAVFGNPSAAKNNGDLHPLSTSVDTGCISRNVSKQARAMADVPDEVLEGFSSQIKRIEENHQIELDETEQRHTIEIEKLTAMYNACVQSKKELEERLQLEIKTKEEQLNDTLRRNEGHRLKLDVLKREVSGTQELLQSRELEIKKMNEKYLHDLRAIEKQVVMAEQKANKSDEELQKIQKSMQVTQDEHNTLKEEHETLLQRAKSLASELKERRAVCRQLESLLDEETKKNHSLQRTIDSLEERLNHQGMSQTEKDSEMDQLRAQLVDSKLEVEKVEKVWREKEAKNELILTEYKKRAQLSLAMANSRTASAVQAREEAELDARSARAMADAALERANKAENSSRESIAEAMARVEAMIKERDTAVTSLELLKSDVKSIELKLTNTQQELDNVRIVKEKKDLEVERLRKEIDEAETKALSTQQKLIESTNAVDSLREEVVLLRDQLQHATVHSAEIVASNVQSNDLDNRDLKTSISGSHDDGDDSTVSALRAELREANDAIEDLKAALKNAVELNEQKEDQHSNEPSSSSESIPLFYAMEKQAELKTARAEMNRLASLVADVQSEKMEAYEAMEAMRRRMEDAEARLKRHEKLGSLPTSFETRMQTEQDINTALNIEYLKHVMLRFMNAKSTTEKKTLVPVIAAVLELTPDEAQTAMKSVEHNPMTGVVGSNLFGFMS